MNQQYAGFGIRFVAALIDGILISLIFRAIILIIQYYMYAENSNGEPSIVVNIFIVYYVVPIVFAILIIGYNVIYQKIYGQTIGKKVMNIKVITYDGNTPTILTFFSA